MRSTGLTGSQTKALASLKDLSTRLRVSVDDGSGSYQDLTDLEGYNWIDSVVYDLQAGEPVSKAQVKLVREAHKLSLSPFVDGSKLNADGTVVDIARKILIETAVLPRGKNPVAAEWEKIFRGYITRINWAKSPMVLECQDQGYRLMRWFIMNQYVYAETDDLLHEVIQDIVDDNHEDLGSVAAQFTWDTTTTVDATGGDTSELAVGDFIGYARGPLFEITAITPNVDVTIDNTGGRTIPSGAGAGSTVIIAAADRITLYVEGANPTWAIKTYAQSKGRVLERCRVLAQQIGYEVSYRWNQTAGDFVLTLWTPDRSAAVPDFTIGPGVYKDVSKMSMDLSRIRNWLRVTATVSGVRTSVIRQDAASQAKYGLAPAELTEGAASQIDTLPEIQDLGDIVLSDLAEPEADAVFPVPYRWDLQIGDYGRFEADGVRFDSDQDLAVVGLKHAIPNTGEPSTQIITRGVPSGGANRWLELEGVPGVAPPTDLREDDAPSGESGTPDAMAVIVEFDDPRAADPPVSDWAYSRVYNRAGADPGDPPSLTYLVAVGKQTRFRIDGLLPETEYHTRVEHVDAAGNVGAVCDVIQTTSQAVGAYHENHDQERGAMNPNPNFGTATRAIASYEPDHWEVDTGSWENTAGNWWHESGTGATCQTGKRAVELNGIACPGSGTITRIFQTLAFPVSGSYLYGVTFAWQHDGNTGNRTAWKPQIEWLDEDGGTLSTDDLVDTINLYSHSGLTTTASTWHIDRGWGTAPSTARYARVVINVVIPTAAVLGQASHPTMVFDRFVFTRSLAQLEWDQSGGTNRALNTGTWGAPWLDTSASIDNAQGESPGVPLGPIEHDYDVQFDGQYMIDGRVVWTSGTNGTTFAARLRNNGATIQVGTPNVKYAGSGAYAVVFLGQIQLSAGDAIRLEGYHNEGGPLTIDNSECYLRITQISTQGSF